MRWTLLVFVLSAWAVGGAQSTRAQESTYSAWGIAASGIPEPTPQPTPLPTPAPPKYPARFSPDDVLAAAAAARHPGAVACIFRYEVGGGLTTREGVRYERYDPYMPHGDSRVYGPAGLAAFGLLPEFQRRVSANLEETPDPSNPYQVAWYVDQVLDEGRGSWNWPEIASGACPAR